MEVSSLQSSSAAYDIFDTQERKKREAFVAESRNTGPDTVSFSHEAMEKYHAMRNSSNGSAETGGEDPRSSLGSSLLGKNQESGKKFQKMDQAELLAFLKSDNFSQDAMRYVKAVASDNKMQSNDEDESSDMLIKTMESNKNNDKSENAADNTIESQVNSSSGSAFVNGKRATEKELAAEIQKAEEEVRELTATYEQIMSGEGSEEEKSRLSQPVYKRLKDRFEELQGLKAQAKSLADEKYAMKTA